MFVATNLSSKSNDWHNIRQREPPLEYFVPSSTDAPSLGFVDAVLAYFLFPETKGEPDVLRDASIHTRYLTVVSSSGKTLEEIAIVFGDTNVVRPPTEHVMQYDDEEKKMGDFSHNDHAEQR